EQLEQQPEDSLGIFSTRLSKLYRITMNENLASTSYHKYKVKYTCTHYGRDGYKARSNFYNAYLKHNCDSMHVDTRAYNLAYGFLLPHVIFLLFCDNNSFAKEPSASFKK
ncbi:hypothetical protein ACJX0J_030654, partial [Zea mays]